MGKVIIDPITDKNPITTLGRMVAPCYGSDSSVPEKNYKRGLRCIKDGHGRVLEYAQAFLIFEGYSARVVREYYTHIGGAPTRTQASTRYINYEDFEYIIPPSIQKNPEALKVYKDTMTYISGALTNLESWGIPKEDSANLLPLGMTSTFTTRTNARMLGDMAAQRLCMRAYWEYRQMMKDIIAALSDYSEEWATICSLIMECKCDKVGYCLENKTCGKYPQKELTI